MIRCCCPTACTDGLSIREASGWCSGRRTRRAGTRMSLLRCAAVRTVGADEVLKKSFSSQRRCRRFRFGRRCGDRSTSCVMAEMNRNRELRQLHSTAPTILRSSLFTNGNPVAKLRPFPLDPSRTRACWTEPDWCVNCCYFPRMKRFYLVGRRNTVPLLQWVARRPPQRHSLIDCSPEPRWKLGSISIG